MFQFLMRHQQIYHLRATMNHSVSDNLDGVVDQVWKWSGYDTYAFNHDLALQHLSLGAHDLCFDVVRACEETYIDTDGTEYQNPFAGITEQCSACLDNKFEVILPELDEKLLWDE